MTTPAGRNIFSLVSGCFTASLCDSKVTPDQLRLFHISHHTISLCYCWWMCGCITKMKSWCFFSLLVSNLFIANTDARYGNLQNKYGRKTSFWTLESWVISFHSRFHQSSAPKHTIEAGNIQTAYLRAGAHAVPWCILVVYLFLVVLHQLYFPVAEWFAGGQT